MTLNKLITDREFYNKIPNNLSDEEKEILYVNVYKIRKMLIAKNAELGRIPRKLAHKKQYVKKVICECCGREMSNKYLYLHKKTRMYKTNMELKKFKDKKDDSI